MVSLKKISYWFLIFLGMFSLILWILFPFYWILITAFKPPTEQIRYPPLLWVNEPYFQNFINALSGRFPYYFMNTILSSLFSLLFSLAIGIPASYGIARAGKALRIKGKDSLYFTFITFRMLPLFVFIIPLYFLYRTFGLFDTLPGLVIAYLLIDIPLMVWFLTEFFENVPLEIEDAFVLDGFPRWRAVLGVTIPVSLPGIIATSIICLIFTWSDLLLALTLTSETAKTATYALLGTITFVNVEWGKMCAEIIILILPILFFSFFIQKYLVRGLAFGVVR